MGEAEKCAVWNRPLVSADMQAGRRSVCRTGVAVLAWGAAGCLVSPAFGQSAEAYPTRPVHLIVPASAGGATDVIGRVVAERLAQALKQPVIIENRPGASATLGPAAVARSAPDGYTLLFTSSTPIVMVPNTMKSVPYNVQKDFVTVSIIGATPLMVFVNATGKVSNLKELFAEARARPDTASYGSFGNGTSAHVLMELLIKQGEVKMIHVPYKGISPALQDLAGGQLMVSVADVGSALPLIKAGKVRPVAIAGNRRSPLLPEVATFDEQGIKGMEPFAPWFGVMAPAATPNAVVERLSAELMKIAGSAEFGAKLATLGSVSAVTTPAQANELLMSDYRNWQGLVRDLTQIKFE